MERGVLRSSLIAAIPVAALFLLAGCGGDSTTESGKESSSAGKTGNTSFLTMQLRPTFDDYFKPIFQKFEAAHPGATVEWLDYPFQSYETKIMTSHMAKNPPDVLNLASGSISTFIEAGLLRDLDWLLPQDVIDSYLPNILEQGCTFDGKLYALPWYAAGAVTFYNTKILEDAGLDPNNLPTDYSELPTLMKTVREKTGKFGYFPLYTESGTLRNYLLEAGVPILDETGTKAAFNTPRGVEIFKFWTDLYRDKLAPSEALTAMHRRPIELYKSGNLAMLETGPQFLKQIKSDAPEIYSQTAVGPDLGWKGESFRSLVLQTLAISSLCDDPKQAAELAAFVTNAENQLSFCKQTVILPSVAAAIDDPYFTEPEDTLEGQARRYSAAVAKIGVIPPIPPNSKKLFKILDDITEQVALGKMTAEQGLAKAEKEWNAVLAEGAK